MDVSCLLPDQNVSRASKSSTKLEPNLHVVLPLMSDESRRREVLVAEDDLLNDVEAISKVASF